ncbi:hypothetical protein EHN25_22590 [Salmonella enterica]|nr:hypothetical protein [Salmonella enterica]
MATTITGATSNVAVQSGNVSGQSMDMTSFDLKEQIIATFKELAEQACEIRNMQLTSATTQEVSSWGRQVSSFQHQRDSASKTMKSTILAGAGEVVGGIVSMGCSFGGHVASKGITHKERYNRRQALKGAKGLAGDALDNYLKANKRPLNPHSKLGILGQCGEPIGKLISQPFSIGGSIIGSGAKKLDSIAEMDKYNSNLALNNAKQYADAGKKISSQFATVASSLASAAERFSRAITAVAG